MSNIQYRTATLKDLPTLLNFEQELISYERPFDSNLKDDCTYYDLNYLITSDNAELIVAFNDKEILGCGYGKIVNAKPYHKNTQYVYMGFMYVKPEYRGQGIVQDIISKLKDWSVTKNLFEIRLEVYNKNASALKAYENHGFKKHMIEMKLNLK
ncbi:GNAT family N-acetyltransferase [Olleya aquimaris]|uniref:Ribosomal protein S18 acetylase RimI-like enzyme n=1 Tax=Olleya aquimaris TaxID=639310 RepID=A0A327RCY9_9FLAO|nr:GNAT family N-acetyltransferase [Olleya aquimaris]RAJ13444.1 ribosomal protein S18 acetylase RimI-like enzyme [Olleya aquimaris]